MNQVSLKPESATVRDASGAKIGTENCPARSVRLCRLVGGQEILANQVEKNGLSPKTWYCAIFQMKKLETFANQNDAPESGRNRSRKFLRFLENFSGVYIPPRWRMLSEWPNPVPVYQCGCRLCFCQRQPECLKNALVKPTAGG
jgi:hypothetical protein